MKLWLGMWYYRCYYSGIGYDFFWPDFAFTALTGRKSIDSYCTEVLRLPSGYFRTNSTEISVFFIM